MALITCPECGKQISDKASSCPQCGYILQASKTKTTQQWINTRNPNKVWLIVSGILLIPVLFCASAAFLGVPDIYNYHEISIIETCFYGMAFILVCTSILTITHNTSTVMYVVRGLIMALIAFLVYAIYDDLSRINGYYTGEYENDYDSTTEATAINSTNESEENSIGWTYDEEIDDLTNKRVAVSATLESLNTNPYNAKGDETKMLLVLRYGKLGFAVQNGVMLCLAEGNEHFDCKYADSFGSGFLAVFDDGEIDETWRLVSKPNKNALVVTDSQEANDFIAKAKNAHTCKLQVNIDGIGMKTFTFNVEGLEWDY